MSSSDDFFGGGLPSAKFPTIGTAVQGEITRIGETMQQRDFTTGELKKYSDGNPMTQLPIDVRTEERDPSIPNDDGQRTIYVKGQMRKAFREALRQAGAPGPRVGGKLRVVYVGDDAPQSGRGIASKRYEVRYAAPAGKPVDDFFGGQPAGQPAPQPVAAGSAPAGDDEPPW